MWQKILRTSFRDRAALADFLELAPPLRAQLVDTPFPLNLPRRLAHKIRKNTLNDPLLRQYVALEPELESPPGFGCDPVGDCSAQQEPRLLRKYAGRALLLCSSACAMHCRYCFRRHFPYAETPAAFEDELHALAKDTSLREVILSGGDPLSLSNRVLGDLIKRLDAIPHLRLLRIHSRFPVGIPERLDDEFISLLHGTRLQPWFVVHINHPRELDDDVIDALRRLRVPLLNQSVLLKDVNDDLETLTQLCESLINAGIKPYYLHQLDHVQGAHHFEVPIEEGLQLMRELRARLPGYAVPTYVREDTGADSKTPLGAEVEVAIHEHKDSKTQRRRKTALEQGAQTAKRSCNS